MSNNARMIQNNGEHTLEESLRLRVPLLFIDYCYQIVQINDNNVTIYLLFNNIHNSLKKQFYSHPKTLIHVYVRQLIEGYSDVTMDRAVYVFLYRQGFLTEEFGFRVVAALAQVPPRKEG